jgi:hypothetical protein
MARADLAQLRAGGVGDGAALADVVAVNAEDGIASLR